MRNPSAKRVNHGQNAAEKKQKNNLYMKKELIKIMFKKNGNNEKASQTNKLKNNINLQKNRTRNHINSKSKENEQKYISLKSSNLNSLEGVQRQDNINFGRIGKNNLTHKSNKQNMQLSNRYNTQINEGENVKLENHTIRPITRPNEKEIMVGCKSCGKNNEKTLNNRYNLNKNFNLIFNNNISENFSNNIMNIRDPKSV